MSIPISAPSSTTFLQGRWNIAKSILNNHPPSSISLRLAQCALDGWTIDQMLAEKRRLEQDTTPARSDAPNDD